jgi:hypothetical protein
MTPLVIAQLIAGYGLPLAQQIFTWVNSGKTTVTQADFDALVALSKYRSSDALAAAGISIVNGVVVPKVA